MKNETELKVGRANNYDIPIIPQYFWSLYKIILPLKVLNVLGSRRNSRLYQFVQHIQYAIEDFKMIFNQYENDESALEILNEITIQFFARIKTWKCFNAMIASYLCTPHGKLQFQQLMNMMSSQHDENDIINSNIMVFTMVSLNLLIMEQRNNLKLKK